MLKRLKNIEDKTDNQIRAIESQKDNQSSIKFICYSIRDRLPWKALKAFDNLLAKNKTINYNNKCGKDLGNDEHDFTMFSSMGELLRHYTMETFQCWVQKENKMNFITSWKILKSLIHQLKKF